MRGGAIRDHAAQAARLGDAGPGQPGSCRQRRCRPSARARASAGLPRQRAASRHSRAECAQRQQDAGQAGVLSVLPRTHQARPSRRQAQRVAAVRQAAHSHDEAARRGWVSGGWVWGVGWGEDRATWAVWRLSLPPSLGPFLPQSSPALPHQPVQLHIVAPQRTRGGPQAAQCPCFAAQARWRQRRSRVLAHSRQLHLVLRGRGFHCRRGSGGSGRRGSRSAGAGSAASSGGGSPATLIICRLTRRRRCRGGCRQEACCHQEACGLWGPVERRREGERLVGGDTPGRPLF